MKLKILSYFLAFCVFMVNINLSSDEPSAADVAARVFEGVGIAAAVLIGAVIVVGGGTAGIYYLRYRSNLDVQPVEKTQQLNNGIQEVLKSDPSKVADKLEELKDKGIEEYFQPGKFDELVSSVRSLPEPAIEQLVKDVNEQVAVIKEAVAVDPAKTPEQIAELVNSRVQDIVQKVEIASEPAVPPTSEELILYKINKAQTREEFISAIEELKTQPEIIKTSDLDQLVNNLKSLEEGEGMPAELKAQLVTIEKAIRSSSAKSAEEFDDLLETPIKDLSDYFKKAGIAAPGQEIPKADSESQAQQQDFIDELHKIEWEADGAEKVQAAPDAKAEVAAEPAAPTVEELLYYKMYNAFDKLGPDRGPKEFLSAAKELVEKLESQPGMEGASQEALSKQLKTLIDSAESFIDSAKSVPQFVSTGNQVEDDGLKKKIQDMEDELETKEKDLKFQMENVGKNIASSNGKSWDGEFEDFLDTPVKDLTKDFAREGIIAPTDPKGLPDVKPEGMFEIDQPGAKPGQNVQPENREGLDAQGIKLDADKLLPQGAADIIPGGEQPLDLPLYQGEGALQPEGPGDGEEGGDNSEPRVDPNPEPEGVLEGT
jgi:hypothetical protein